MSLQVADLQTLEATIEASMPGERESRDFHDELYGQRSCAEVSEDMVPDKAPAQQVKAAVCQPGCLAKAQPIAAGNVGMRLLEKMGWQEGSGNGKVLALTSVVTAFLEQHADALKGVGMNTDAELCPAGPGHLWPTC